MADDTLNSRAGNLVRWFEAYARLLGATWCDHVLELIDNFCVVDVDATRASARLALERALRDGRFFRETASFGRKCVAEKLQKGWRLPSEDCRLLCFEQVPWAQVRDALGLTTPPGRNRAQHRVYVCTHTSCSKVFVDRRTPTPGQKKKGKGVGRLAQEHFCKHLLPPTFEPLSSAPMSGSQSAALLRELRFAPVWPDQPPPLPIFAPEPEVDLDDIGTPGDLFDGISRYTTTHAFPAGEDASLQSVSWITGLTWQGTNAGKHRSEDDTDVLDDRPRKRPALPQTVVGKLWLLGNGDAAPAP